MKELPWQEKLRKRFKYNIKRVNNLLRAAEPMADTNCGKDIVRAAVVLLHASLEDVLRTVQIRKLPTDSDEALANVAIEWKGDKKVMNYTLGMLRRLKGKSIDEFIEERVTAHYNRRSYSDKDDLVTAATMIGVSGEKAGRLAHRLEALMERRHQIVHQGDRDPVTDDDHGLMWEISATEVDPWISAVVAFVETVIEQASLIKASPSK